jgi:hypothetical protein
MKTAKSPSARSAAAKKLGSTGATGRSRKSAPAA